MSPLVYIILRNLIKKSKGKLYSVIGKYPGPQF